MGNAGRCTDTVCTMGAELFGPCTWKVPRCGYPESSGREVLERSKAPGAAAVGQGTQPSRLDGNLALAAEEWSQC